MSIPVRQSTAFECAIGPVLDADGVAVTGCVVADFKLKKTTGNFAALNASATLTHVSAGVYDLVLTTSDLDTVGLATIAIDDTTNGCASLHLQVMEEVIYDALYAASANTFTGAAGSTKVNGVVLVDTVTILTGYVDHTAAIAAVKADTAATLADTGTDGVVVADGAITSAKFTVSAPSGVATGILERLDQLWRRFFKRATKSGTQLKTYADNGTSVLTTQSYTSAGDDDDVGAAS